MNGVGRNRGAKVNGVVMDAARTDIERTDIARTEAILAKAAWRLIPVMCLM